MYLLRPYVYVRVVIYHTFRYVGRVAKLVLLRKYLYMYSFARKAECSMGYNL